MLYRPEAFEALTERPWHEAWVGDAIRRIVADADAAFDPDGFWPAEEWDAWMTRAPLKTLYVGAAGVLHALDVLRRRGCAEPRLDLATAARRLAESWQPDEDLPRYDLPQPARAGLLTGETGILAVAWRLAPAGHLADRLLGRVRENVRNEADDLMWGLPGTLAAAGSMLGWSGDPRWARAWHDSADELLRRRDEDGLWTQRLYGSAYRGLATAHGLVGNVRVLLAGPLDEERRRSLARDANTVLARAAVVEDGLANWPYTAEGALEDEDDHQVRLQWCAGAPGIVTAAWDYLDEELVLAGAGTAWAAGPHGPEKGPSICHGTAGNGYAFLKAFARTGDERWLERARRFAVHALEQAEQRPRRWSLWTGDLGVALYAADCLEARTDYPVLDTWD